MILTYADMSIRITELVTIDERSKRIIERISAAKGIPDNMKKEMIELNYRALTRFKRYETLVHSLLDVDSVFDIQNIKTFINKPEFLSNVE